MAWFWWLLVILVAVIWVFTVVDIVRRRHERSGGKTAAWILIVLIFPILGSIVYFLVNGAAEPGPPRDTDVSRGYGGRV
ncbi:MAG TPA: PLD nuclease N-terminal domain-containing protein [Gaiellaceae bacterium]|nr:PLD nuclease N-terminal domain-containing protein [Gaiellaceae bacterium]